MRQWPTIPIEMTVEDTEDVVTLHVRGEVDLATAGQLDGELRRLLQRDQRPVVVDLRRLEFMDARGVAVLEAALASVRSNGRGERGLSLLLAGGQLQIRRILEMTGLSDRIVVRPGPPLSRLAQPAAAPGVESGPGG
jgi:anti-sigma B factor antagonist